MSTCLVHVSLTRATIETSSCRSAVLPPELTDTQNQLIPFKKNWEALAELQRENEQFASGWAVSMLAGAGTYFTAPLIPPAAISAGLAGLAISTWTQWRAKKVIRLLQTIKPLLEMFESQGIEIYPRIPVEEGNPIDLFIRFPRKTHLFISIRSRGDREVVYNEKREILQLKKKGKPGLVTWNPDPLLELASYEKWLNKNRGLFAMSSREAIKTPAAKVLILWHPTTAETHNPELYTELGDLRLLALRRKGTAFVIQEEEIINFVQAWLARYD